MEKQNIHGVSILQSKLLSRYKKVIHGFTTKRIININQVWQEKKIKANQVVQINQVHSTEIARVKKINGGQIISNTDGLLTGDSNLILSIKTADCLPILLYNPRIDIVIALHAGWRGIVDGFIIKAIDKMKDSGCQPADIIMAIGPHIGGCCFEVGKDVAKKFSNRFGNDPFMVFTIAQHIFIDLAYCASMQALHTGLKKEHIDAMINCTYCQKNIFYSYRRGKKYLRGHIDSFIGIIDEKN